MVARYVPARMGGFMMGAYFIASGVSQYLGGVVATYASVPRNITDPLESLPIYTNLFNKLGLAALVCKAIAIAVLPLMKRLSLTHHSSQTQYAGKSFRNPTNTARSLFRPEILQCPGLSHIHPQVVFE